MSEFEEILLETYNLDVDNIIEDENPINLNYQKLKQDLNAIRDKSTIQWIDRSNYSLNKLEGNTFYGFYQLIDLDLSHNIITYLPIGVFNQLLNLQVVNLSHNLISELKAFIFSNNKQLTLINLSNNLLIEINSRAFQNLPVLRILDFSYNKIQKLLRYCVNCKSLQELNLSFNQINDVDSIAFVLVPNLIHLHLSNNKITFLKKRIFKTTTKIETLNFRNNLIQKIEKRTFINLHNLKQVDFSNNLLETCGNSFENKPNLHEVNLLNNPIKTFWTSYFRITDNIRTLRLSIHELQKIENLRLLRHLSDFELHVETDEIFQLHQSVFFWLNESSIQKLYLIINRGEFNVDYSTVNLFNLEVLHIEFRKPSNQLSIFNIIRNINILRKLKHMALININKLQITGSTSIHEHNLTYLNLTGIENESIYFLRNNFIMLEHLDLSFSKVQFISRDVMSTLPYLKTLIMNSTKISVIVANLFHHNFQLEVIEFKDCQIHTIAENCFQNLEKLVQIDIRGNKQLRITQSLLNGIPKFAIIYYD